MGFKSVPCRELLDIATKHGYRFTVPLTQDASNVTIHLHAIDDISSTSHPVGASSDSEENQIATAAQAQLEERTASGNTILLTFKAAELRSETINAITNIQTVINITVRATCFTVLLAKPSDSKTSLFYLKRRSQIPLAENTRRKTSGLRAAKTTKRRQMRKWWKF